MLLILSKFIYIYTLIYIYTYIHIERERAFHLKAREYTFFFI